MHLVEANGARIPALGFGTWELKGRTARAMVETALAVGYRHIDTAQMYGNETEVGAAIRASGVPRDEIFLATKVWPDCFRRGDLERSVVESLRRLGVDAVDLVLLHWPNPSVPLAETIAALDEVRDRGLARHVGVSNFNVTLLDETLELARSPIVTNQVEFHPFLNQRALLHKQQPLGIALTAYCPLARGRVFGEPTIERIARHYGKTAGQVALRWLLDHDLVIVVPRSSKPEHVRSNFEVFDFELTREERIAIDALHGPRGRIVDFAGLAPDWDSLL